MRSLESIIRGCYGDIEARYSTIRTGWYSSEMIKYIVVPISDDIIEVPVMALHAIDRATELPDDLVIEVRETSARSSYKTIDSSIRDSLGRQYGPFVGLIKLPSKDTDVMQYYATKGAIFDLDLKPVVIFTWKLKKVITDETTQGYTYRYVKPILRISPEIIRNKDNTVKRYISNKIIPAALSIRVIDPTPSARSVLSSRCAFHSIEIIIDELPFKLRKPNIPSISTTNRQLLDIAIDNIEDVMQ